VSCIHKYYGLDATPLAESGIKDKLSNGIRKWRRRLECVVW